VPPPRTKLTAAARTREVDLRLERIFGGTAASLCALRHRNPFELLVATVLSAQCTDERVNEVTIGLFARYPTPSDLAAAALADVEALIYPTGFFHAKAEHLVGLSSRLVTEFDGDVPRSMEALTSLPGVGRKTANVVRSVAFDEPGLPVDTHVIRLSHRLDLARSNDPVAIERTLGRALAPARQGAFSVRVILHGRRTCVARRPRCDECALEDLCPRRGVGAAVARVSRAP
jgi:endonuclease-3